MSNAQPQADKPPVRVGRRIILALGILVVALVGIAYFDRSRSSGDLQALLRRLDADDPHWRLADIEANRERFADHENSAVVILQMARLTPKGWPDPALGALFDKVPPQERLPDDLAATLEKTLASAPAVLGQVRLLAGMPRGRYEMTHAYNPLATLYPHADSAAEAARIARLEAWRLAQQGDIEGALLVARCGLNVGRSLGDEPSAITQYARNTAVEIACASIERTLAQGEATAAELERVQNALALEDEHLSFRVAARGERAEMHDLLDKLVRGGIDSGLLWRQLHGRHNDWWQGWWSGQVSRRDHGECLRVMNGFVESTYLPEADRVAEELRIHTATTTRPRGWVVEKLTPSMLRIAEACRRKHTVVRCLLVAVAVERFRLATGAWPDNLDQLKPKYLAAIPLDPYDGKPLRFAKAKDGVVIYALGKDGTDDGGQVFPRPAADEGYRLWNVNKRRQSSPHPGEPPP